MGSNERVNKIFICEIVPTAAPIWRAFALIMAGWELSGPRHAERAGAVE